MKSWLTDLLLWQSVDKGIWLSENAQNLQVKEN